MIVNGRPVSKFVTDKGREVTDNALLTDLDVDNQRERQMEGEIYNPQSSDR